MLLKKHNNRNTRDKYYHYDNIINYTKSNSGDFCLIIVLFLMCLSFQTVTSEPISGSQSSSSGSSSSSSSAGSSLGGGTWTIRAIPHQSGTAFSTLLEQVYNLKYSWESSIDHVIRKIEMLESKIGRLDTSNQLRLEKLTESVNSKEIKDELAMEQLMRKLDANYERFNHKIGYMETRLDAALNKMQTNIDNGFNRIETRQTDIDSELTDLSQAVDEVKVLTIQLDDKHNTTQKSMHRLQAIITESASSDQIEKLTGTIQHIGEKLKETANPVNPQNINQNDASGQFGLDTDRIIQTIKSEVDQESHRIENKISNMYNDLWRRYMSLEMTVKTSLTQGNTTRRVLQEDFRTLLQQYEKQRNTEPDSQENYMEIVMDAVMSTVQELTKRVESNFQMVLTSQNLFMENCHRLQLNEPQLESKISLVLEKILNTITNKTMRVDNRLVETMEMIKSYQNQAMRSLGHTTKMIVTLTDETNKESKNLESALIELAGRNEFVAMTVQELQEDIEMLANITSTKLNQEFEDWFNKSINENNFLDNENEETANKTSEEQNSAELTDQSITPTDTLKVATRNRNNNNNVNTEKSIKFPDSEEVIKIFTEEENMNDNNTNKGNNFYNNTTNNLEKTIKDKKISIIIPNKYYAITENDNRTNNLNRSTIEILVNNLLNQTNETLNVADVSAIILNTESDKADNSTSYTDNQKGFITELLKSDDKSTNNKTNSEFQNENCKNTSVIINMSIENKLNNSNNVKINKSNENVTIIENKTMTPNSTKLQSITEQIKNKLEEYRSQRNFKLINNIDLNQSNKRFQQSSSQNNNIKKLFEQYNKKRRNRNLIDKYLNTSTLQSENESKLFKNRSTTLINHEIPENEQEDTKETYSNTNDGHNFNEEKTSPQLSDEVTNNEDSSNFYDTKYPNTETDFSNIHGTDLNTETKDKFPYYDDTKL